MPPNTPAIYIVGALIALGGVLFGALGQIVSSTLQRRHERRLKLDEVRRETYAAVHAVLLDLPRLAQAAREAVESAETIKANPSEVSAEVRQWRVQRMADEAEEFKAVRLRWEALRSTVLLIGGPEVRRELEVVVSRLGAAETLPDGATDAFLNACRKELGATPDVVNASSTRRVSGSAGG